MDTQPITKLTDADREATFATLTLAFAADPVMRWMFPNGKQYCDVFADFMGIFGGLAFDHGEAYSIADGAGIALWLPPGVHEDEEALQELMMRTVAPEKLAEMGENMEQMASYRPDEDYWYLAVLGVDPAAQGQGLGRQLLDHKLAEIDAAGTASFLDSSNPLNVSLYRRHGFNALDVVNVGGKPVLTPMLRPAQS